MRFNKKSAPGIFFLLFILIQATGLKAQSTGDTLYPLAPLNYQKPAKYVVGGVDITGVTYLDPNIVRLFTGLYIGQPITIPGDEITAAIEYLWKQKLFTDVKVLVTNVVDNKIFLEFQLQENPRLNRPIINGLRKSQAKSLREEISASKGDMVTENLKQNTINEIKRYYIEKGYLDVQVTITEVPTTEAKNSVDLAIDVKKNSKAKIEEIIIEGNSGVTDQKLKKALPETKERKIYRFKKARYIEEKYESGKKELINYYNSKGYRDAQILRDSVYRTENNNVGIKIIVHEGPKYYFRNITVTGNTKYRSTYLLDSVVRIKKGDIYDISQLEGRLYMSPNNSDLSSIYMDDGYLFFNVVPVETKVENDSIDIEIRITEGPQALVNKVLITGNTKTSDYVILREIRVRPGQKFSRSDIQRSVRELAALGYFDPEKIEVNPMPNYSAGTVDIEFRVEERPSDQVELSGGFGAGFIVGTLGLNLTNFSTRKMFKKGEWAPIPAGDGQRLSLRAQSNGAYFQSYNASFTEPWFGGKRPQSFSVTVFHSIQTNGMKKGDANRQSITISGVTVGMGRLLKWPDDYFYLSYGLTYQKYNLSNFSSVFSFATGISDNVNFKIALSRNSIDQPIYPRSGTNVTLSLQITPPFSLWSGVNYEGASDQVKYKWIEYHKWKFEAAWYTTLVDKLVLATQAKFGYIGFYNRHIGASPFERFYVGGAGLIGFNLDGRELISMRGYKDNSVTPLDPKTRQAVGGTIYNKFTAELRYPISTNPQATVYVLTFAEAGNNFSAARYYNPFNLLRSAGGGVRVFLPMFGLLGLDYGYGFDQNPYSPLSGKGQFHFFIGQQF